MESVTNGESEADGVGGFPNAEVVSGPQQDSVAVGAARDANLVMESVTNDGSEADGVGGFPNGEVVSGPQQDSVAVGAARDANMAGEAARPEATFRFTVANVSRLRVDEAVLSPAYYARHLAWQIKVTTHETQIAQGPTQRSLGLFLQCNGERQSPGWWCRADAELRLHSHRPDGAPLCRTIQSKFSSAERDCGFPDFVSWQDVLDPGKGYIADDSITVEVHLVAEATYRVSRGSAGPQDQDAQLQASEDSNEGAVLPGQCVPKQRDQSPISAKLHLFVESDYHTFLRGLLAKLESDARCTCVESTVLKLPGGGKEISVRCKFVKNAGAPTPSSYDIQLSVTRRSGVYESLRRSVVWEQQASACGLSRVPEHLMLESVPPALQLHHRRFLHHLVTGYFITLNGNLQYLEGSSLSEDEQEAAPPRYTLHAVLMHWAGDHQDKYIAFIEPRADGSSCQCNGEELEVRWSSQQSANSDVPDRDTPKHLSGQLAQEEYVTVNVFIDSMFGEHRGFGLYDPEHVSPRVFCVPKHATLLHMMEALAETIRCPLERIRPWPIVQRPNNTRRAAALDWESNRDRSMADVAQGQDSWDIYLEVWPSDSDTSALQYFDRDQDLLLFLKLYDPSQQYTAYRGRAYALLTMAVREFIPYLNEHLGFPAGTELLLYQEVQPNLLVRIYELDEPLPNVAKGLTSGDIIVVEKAEDEQASKLPSAVDYYRDLYYRVQLTFADYSIENDAGFTLSFPLHTEFQALKSVVAERLNIDPRLLQFFSSRSSDVSGHLAPWTPDNTIRDLLLILEPKMPRKLFYAELGKPGTDFEDKKRFQCVWYSLDFTDERTIILYPNKSGTVADLLVEARKQVRLSLEQGSGQLRILKERNNILHPGPDLDAPLLELDNSLTYRIEEIRRDELNLGADEMLVPCAHFQRDTSWTFGVPFYIRARHGEPFAYLKDRMQEKLAVPDMDWEKYQFAIVCFNQPWYIYPDEYVMDLAEFRGNRAWLGLDHDDMYLTNFFFSTRIISLERELLTIDKSIETFKKKKENLRVRALELRTALQRKAARIESLERKAEILERQLLMDANKQFLQEQASCDLHELTANLTSELSEVRLNLRICRKNLATAKIRLHETQHGTRREPHNWGDMSEEPTSQRDVPGDN